jgi:hypothetical protein
MLAPSGNSHGSCSRPSLPLQRNNISRLASTLELWKFSYPGFSLSSYYMLRSLVSKLLHLRRQKLKTRCYHFLETHTALVVGIPCRCNEIILADLPRHLYCQNFHTPCFPCLLNYTLRSLVSKILYLWCTPHSKFLLQHPLRFRNCQDHSFYCSFFKTSGDICTQKLQWR